MWSDDKRHNEECGQMIKGTGSPKVFGGKAAPVPHCLQHPHELPWNRTRVSALQSWQPLP